jgi:hypothetical protein
MLDVNSIHHILALTENIDDLVHDLNNECQKEGYNKENLQQLWLTHAVPSRYDSEKVIYVKRLLQHALPAAMRRNITSILFEKYIGINQTEFAENLYMTETEIKELRNSGMYIGSHGYEHLWLNKEDIQTQERDIDLSLQFLSSIGASTEDWIMCYPYGAFNDQTIRILRERGCAVGITTVAGSAQLNITHPYKLPRFDTNDLPK